MMCKRTIGKFSQYFRRNFIVVDNNDAKEDVFGQVYKQVMSLAKSKVQNPMGQKWIANAIAMKRRMSGGQSPLRSENSDLQNHQKIHTLKPRVGNDYRGCLTNPSLFHVYYKSKIKRKREKICTKLSI